MILGLNKKVQGHAEVAARVQRDYETFGNAAKGKRRMKMFGTEAYLLVKMC